MNEHHALTIWLAWVVGGLRLHMRLGNSSIHHHRDIRFLGITYTFAKGGEEQGRARAGDSG